jgi:hypothetical protein
MFWRKKKTNLYQVMWALYQHPDRMYACEYFLATYYPPLERIIVFEGDYSMYSEDELQDILVQKVRSHVASMN